MLANCIHCTAISKEGVTPSYQQVRKYIAVASKLGKTLEQFGDKTNQARLNAVRERAKDMLGAMGNKNAGGNPSSKS